MSEKRRARVYQGEGEWGWYVHRSIDGKPLLDTSHVVGDNPEGFYDAWFPDYEFAFLAADAWIRAGSDDTRKAGDGDDRR